MKQFTFKDVQEHSCVKGAGRLFAETSDLILAPMEWQRSGLQQTASGYGNKLNSGLKISFNGRLYRIYATCWSNVASLWFTVRGRKIFVS